VGYLAIAERQILQDWTRVEDFLVDAGEKRTFEYHVVRDVAAQRVTMTIKCFNEAKETVRLDPTDISSSADPESYPDLAGRRVRHLYSVGRI